MPGCAAVGCTNSAKKGMLMKRFPKDPARRREWHLKMRRDKWKPNDYSFLCEVHFAPDMWEKTRVDGKRKLRSNAVPTIFCFSPSITTIRKSQIQTTASDPIATNSPLSTVYTMNCEQFDVKHEVDPLSIPEIKIEPQDFESEIKTEAEERDDIFQHIDIKHEIEPSIQIVSSTEPISERIISSRSTSNRHQRVFKVSQMELLMGETSLETCSKGREAVKTGKVFKPVHQCCKKECWKKVTCTQQKTLYTLFWDIGDYGKQNYYLSGLMTNSAPRRVLQNPKSDNRVATWTYHVEVDRKSVIVCQQFLLKVVCLGRQRLRTIQEKVLLEVDLSDVRGKHSNRPHKVKEDVWTLFNIMCESIPSKGSHYSQGNTEKKYFVNEELTFKSLYMLFCDYYEAVTSEPLKLSYNTFVHHFQSRSQYSFRQPREGV